MHLDLLKFHLENRGKQVMGWPPLREIHPQSHISAESWQSNPCTKAGHLQLLFSNPFICFQNSFDPF